MFDRISIICLLVFFAGCQSTPPQMLSEGGLLKREESELEKSLFSIEVVTRNEGEERSISGMGFALHRDERECYVVTAAHLLDNSVEIILASPWVRDSNRVVMEVVDILPEVDVAVIRGPLDQLPCFSVDRNFSLLNSFMLGDEHVVYGNPPVKYENVPTKLYQSVANGVIVSVLDSYKGRQYSVLVSSADTSPGFSGGLVTSVENGKPSSVLVGMAIQQLVYEGASGVDWRNQRKLTIILPPQLLFPIATNIIRRYQAFRETTLKVMDDSRLINSND